MRLFTGISVPYSLSEELASFREGNKQLKGLRWVKFESLHITTCFIGELPKARLPHVHGHLKEIAKANRPFTLQFEKIAFSPGEKPYMIWAYFKENEAFTRLSLETNRVLELEMPARQKPIPHVTLARFKKPHYYFNPKNTHVETEAISVAKMTLWESHLQAKSAKYKKLEEFELG